MLNQHQVDWLTGTTASLVVNAACHRGCRGLVDVFHLMG